MDISHSCGDSQSAVAPIATEKIAFTPTLGIGVGHGACSQLDSLFSVIHTLALSAPTVASPEVIPAIPVTKDII